MDELPPTSHNITIVINRLLTEAQQLFGNSVSKKNKNKMKGMYIDLCVAYYTFFC